MVYHYATARGLLLSWASQMAQWVENLLAEQETQEMRVQSLGQEDPLEEEMVTHSSILAWEIPWTEEPSGLQSTGSQSQTRHERATEQQRATANSI